jgi:hypothetical protein
MKPKLSDAKFEELSTFRHAIRSTIRGALTRAMELLHVNCCLQKILFLFSFDVPSFELHIATVMDHWYWLSSRLVATVGSFWAARSAWITIMRSNPIAVSS